jgi:hypothetical protein
LLLSATAVLGSASTVLASEWRIPLLVLTAAAALGSSLLAHRAFPIVVASRGALLRFSAKVVESECWKCVGRVDYYDDARLRRRQLRSQTDFAREYLMVPTSVGTSDPLVEPLLNADLGRYSGQRLAAARDRLTLAADTADRIEMTFLWLALSAAVAAAVAAALGSFASPLHQTAIAIVGPACTVSLALIMVLEISPFQWTVEGGRSAAEHLSRIMAEDEEGRLKGRDLIAVGEQTLQCVSATGLAY